MTEPYRKKLIEVALPLEAINRESAREKSIRHGHPSTLHLWWARRPLAACRAVLFASIVDDPSSRPEEFPTEEDQERERQRLFRIIEELVKWENTSNETVLEAARAEIMKATDGNPPPVLDPFCGGGSIPLEAQRLGLEAHASDLNPVAVLITKALIEIPPRFAGQPPVNPEAREKLAHGATWDGAQGLAEDVRYYGKWMRDQAFERIGNLYPIAKLPNGDEATVIAWLWARTVTCPNPACAGEIPLLNSFALSSRPKRRFSLVPNPRLDVVRTTFGIAAGAPSLSGNISRRGASCLVCGATATLDHVREEGRAGRMSVQLVATVVDGGRNRVYLPASEEHERAARLDAPPDVPEELLSTHPQYMGTPRYGLTHFKDFFTARQLHAMSVFTGLVGAAREAALVDGASADRADTIATYLGLTVGRLANRCSSQSFWEPGGEKVQQVFARQALPMVWFFAEANPFSESSGNFLGQLGYLLEVLRRSPSGPVADVQQLDASTAPMPIGAAVVTDPPYYDNVPYADLSDFFYVWLRRALNDVHPDLFSTLLTPKGEELVADVVRFGGRAEARDHFESGMRHVLERLHEVQDPRVPLALFYAFRQTEVIRDGTVVSTGWETMLEAVLAGGFAIHGTWPIRTEQPGGLREIGRNALASSIVLVCRPRLADAPIATRRELVGALRGELPTALKQLQHGSIAPVDLAQAAIGPGMSVFSRYSRVLESDGSAMTVRSALALINQALDEILAEQEGDFDADTRFAVTWFEQRGFEEGPYGEADVLARAKDTSTAGMVEAGVLVSRGGRVRLLRREEMPDDWDPRSDRRPTAWEAAQHLTRLLANGGEDAAAGLLEILGGGYGEQARELAYRLYSICERKGWAPEALPYNALVIAWPEIARRVAGTPEAEAQQTLGV